MKTQKEKLFEIADKMVDAIAQELATNPVGYRKYPSRVGEMIKNLQDICKMIEENKI